MPRWWRSIAALSVASAPRYTAPAGRVFCAEHVQRGFALGYSFVCAGCATNEQEDGT